MDLVSGGRAAEVQEVWAQDPADRASEVQLVWLQDRGGLVAEVLVVGDQVQVGRADRVLDQAAVHKRRAHGLELAMMAARPLFREWSPVSRAEPQAGEASRRKKSFSGFLER